MNYQYIRDANDKVQYVILPISEFEKISPIAIDEYGIPIEDEDESEWVEIEVEASDNDDATIPHEVVCAMVDYDVNLLGAWRIYRGMSQQEVAARLGISQGAISQMEQPDNKPQKKTLEKFSKIYQCAVEQMY